MNENKTIIKIQNDVNNSNVLEFTPSELPQIISNQVHKMTELDFKIKKVMKEAENAKKTANAANNKISFFSGRKKAIEELQSSGKSLASAIQTNAEALQLSFEFQKELADISKFLIRLGASNIVQNRIVVRQLELKLKGASQEEISVLAREELLSVVRQLKAQEDLFHKQEQHNKKLKELNKQVGLVSENNENLVENVISIEETDKRQDEELKKLIETDKRQDEELKKLIETDKKQEEKLAKLVETDKRHDNELSKQIETDEQHDKKLAELEDKNKQQKEVIAKQVETDKRHDKKLSKLENLNKQHDKKLTNQIETNKQRDKELAKQKEIDKQHYLKIFNLEEKTTKYEKEFEEIKIINENQFVEINKLKEILKQYEQSINFLTNQKKRLNSKLNIVIIIFSVLALLLSLINYFIH